MQEAKLDEVDSIDQFIELINKWYKNNYHGFKQKFDEAVKNAHSLPSDTPPNLIFDWKNATIDKLCNFFREWDAWSPDVSNGLDYIQKFSWLNYKNKAGFDFVTKDPGNLMIYYFVELSGKKMDSPNSIPLVNKWIKELGSKMDDYIIPEGGFKSFNQFFARELKYGKRPISVVNDDSVVVSPADAIINMIEDDLSISTPINVKTQKLNVIQLLNHSKLAAHFEGGTAVSCILMTDVYHHYHAPVSGMVVEADEDVAGNYFGMDDFPKLIHGGNVGYGYDYSIFETFRRGYLIIETKKYGYVAMIPVGLNNIASVKFVEKFKKVTAENPVEICKGEEVGYFQYGGSLNILLFEKGCFPSVRIPQGQIIGTLIEKEAVHKPKLQFVF